MYTKRNACHSHLVYCTIYLHVLLKLYLYTPNVILQGCVNIFLKNSLLVLVIILFAKIKPLSWFSVDARGPVHEHVLTLIQVWMIGYIHYKVWDEITYQFPNFNGQPLKFGNGLVISSHTFLGMWLLIHAGIKVTPC